jgi:hypothetical protein
VKPESLDALGAEPVDVIMLDGETVRQAVPAVAKMMARTAGVYFSDPENLAGAAGAAVLPMMVFRRVNVPFLLWAAVAVAGDRAFRLGYRASRDLHDLAEAARTGDA